MANATPQPPAESTLVGAEEYTYGRAGHRCSYWREPFDVLSINPDRTVTVRWCADGRESTHRTPLDRRDRYIGPTPADTFTS